MSGYGFLFLLTFLTSLTPSTQQHKPTSIGYSCSARTYPKNSTYSSNLNTLLSSLSSKDRDFSNGFLNLAKGQNTDIVSGLYLCVGNISSNICGDCVKWAAKDILDHCPDQKEALIYYDDCLLRYADQMNILLDPTTDSGVMMISPQKIMADQRYLFNDVLLPLFNRTAQLVADSPKYFLTNNSNIDASHKIYVSLQCMPGLSNQTCLNCLQEAIKKVPHDRIGGMVIFPICTLRYELYPFYKRARGGYGEDKTPVVLIVVLTFTSAAILIILSSTAYVYLRRRKVNKEVGSRQRGVHLIESGRFEQDDTQGTDAPSFELETIVHATSNFSNANKLGQGGFGPVFKGVFPGGQEIAVKRLSRCSGQGLEEFKNEVVLIAKLQHRNLVRLLGHCIAGAEKLLIYEYLPHKSLDLFIFDRKLCQRLDWKTRWNIIIGIARGLLYLHQDSRLRIIHRDLKLSNILLDEEMNPKISDFGLARIFGGSETSANTNRVVGTYGYMSPEYALEGLFSFKSDVFSFGVVVIEIISGKRNTGFLEPEKSLSLLGYAWHLWKAERGTELLDQALKETFDTEEFIKCLNVGLLCVQEDPSDRPTMSHVLIMLGCSEAATLPKPKQPAYVLRRCPSSTKPETCSRNELTITLEDGR